MDAIRKAYESIVKETGFRTVLIKSVYNKIPISLNLSVNQFLEELKKNTEVTFLNGGTCITKEKFAIIRNCKVLPYINFYIKEERERKRKDKEKKNPKQDVVKTSKGLEFINGYIKRLENSNPKNEGQADYLRDQITEDIRLDFGEYLLSKVKNDLKQEQKQKPKPEKQVKEPKQDTPKSEKNIKSFSFNSLEDLEDFVKNSDESYYPKPYEIAQLQLFISVSHGILGKIIKFDVKSLNNNFYSSVNKIFKALTVLKFIPKNQQLAILHSKDFKERYEQLYYNIGNIPKSHKSLQGGNRKAILHYFASPSMDIYVVERDIYVEGGDKHDELYTYGSMLADGEFESAYFPLEYINSDESFANFELDFYFNIIELKDLRDERNPHYKKLPIPKQEEPKPVSEPSPLDENKSMRDELMNELKNLRNELKQAEEDELKK